MPRKAAARSRAPGSTLQAVEQLVKALPTVQARRSPLAFAALVLARKLDDESTSPTAAAAVAKELREHIAALTPGDDERPRGDGIDKLAASATRKLRR